MSKIKPHIKGFVTILLNNVLVYSGPNNITANQKTILTRALGASNGSKISNISLYDQGAIVTTKSINNISYPTNNSVLFKALFDENSFNGTIDGMRLITDNFGDFSIKNDIEITKDSSSNLQIEWLIEIN